MRLQCLSALKRDRLRNIYGKGASVSAVRGPFDKAGTAMELRKRHGRQEAHLIKACASAHGVSERCVREWRSSNSPKWKAFLSERAKVASQLGFDALSPSQPFTPQQEEQAAASRFAALQRLADDAVERGDHAGVTALLRAAEQAHRVLVAARDHRVHHEQVVGQLGTAEELRRIVAVSAAVAQLVHRMPAEVAPVCTDPATARAELDRWLHDRFAPAVKELFTTQSDHSNETAPLPTN